jgi:ABC-2 type transport system permease protein
MGGVALFLLSTLGIGLFISTVSRTQQQAMMTTFFFFFPAMLFSGFIFPIANMPVGFQWLSLIDPLRYMLVIIRGVFLKGIGFDVLWTQFAALLGLGAIVLWFAVKRFRKTLA